MTKCSKTEGNRKSSVYNQNGENYFEQVSAYNSMCTHLRRLLLAKHVVDTKNKSYTARKSQQSSKTGDYKPKLIRGDLSDSTIDRLALDVYQHPTMIQRNVDFNVKQDVSPWKHCTGCYNNYHYSGFEDNYTSSDSQSRASSSTSAGTRTRSSSTRSKLRKPLLEINIKTTGSKFIVGKTFAKGGYTFFNQRFEDDTSSPSVSNVEIPTRSSNHLSMLSGLTKWQQNYESNQKAGQLVATSSGSERLEKEKYAKFVYDITRDIMESGRFSDADLHEVFKKHIQQNKGRLNMCKMLSEIYQLKVSLNMVNDAELDQKLEDFAHNELMNTSAIESPPSPRVTDNNETSKKLVPYRTLPGEKSKSSGGKATVPLKSTSELLVTERDVLLSLMEAGIEPKMAQKICKSLHCKSRSPSLADSLQLDVARASVEAEEVHSYNSHFSSEQSTPSTPHEFDSTRESTSKENKDTQINWLTSD